MSIEDISVTKFREYLRIKTVQPNPDYESAKIWLKNVAKELGLEYNIVNFGQPKHFTIWMTWAGTQPKLKSILLNSHIDVVPVIEEKWTHPPFEAVKDSDGKIYARGTQDMKNIGIQYLEAIRRLKATGFVPLRNVHICFVPEEENSGDGGMVSFVKSKEFQNLNIGFGLDEGHANPTDSGYFVFNSDKACWKIKITGKGFSMHGAAVPENTASEKLIRTASKIFAIREAELERMKKDKLTMGEITSINLTMMECGVQSSNIIPPECSFIFDIRITPYWNLEEFEKKLQEICNETDVELTFLEKIEIVAISDLENNIWWNTFKEALSSMNEKLINSIMPGRSDAIYVRKMGIPVLGFSPMKNVPILAHAEDEYLNEKDFLSGIEVYEKILQNITTIPDQK